MIWTVIVAAILDALFPCVQTGPGGVCVPASQAG